MSRSRSSDDEITRWAFAAGGGDRSALERFVRATQQDLWRFIAHLADPQLAEDLSQETYLRALHSLPRFEGRSSARTWLLSIAHRVVIDNRRAANVRPRLANIADWEAAAESAQPATTKFEDNVALSELIKSLDDDRREAFVLTQHLGLSYAEAAKVCDCPVGTIRSRVARARNDLITSMDETSHQRRSAM